MSQSLVGPKGIKAGGLLRAYEGSQTIADATGGVTINPPALAVKAHVAGTLVVTYATGMTDTITVAADQLLHLVIVAIAANSTATGITVFW